MGKLMRRYWVPALLASEIPEPDCPPVRVRVLGEKLLAFRDSEGRPGVINEFCAHRGVSLFFGRNEECGIRCSYHGWKYDILGNCVDLPSQPDHAKKIQITGYPAIEQGDIIWAYMGPPELKPEPPGLEWSMVPPSHRFVSKRLQECNWLQAMEGGIDTTHVSYVHRYEFDEDPALEHSAYKKYVKADPNVVFEVHNTPNGLTIFGRRNGEEDSYYYRITQWIAPWSTLVPPASKRPIGGHVWVPIDDYSCWNWSISYYPDHPLSGQERKWMEEGHGLHAPAIPGTFRSVANKDNDYLIDRKAQKERRSYSGVFGIAMQDTSLQESMGPIQDRSMENLVGTDAAIARTRRVLLAAVDGLEHGAVPPALDAKSQCVRSASVLIDRKADIEDWAAANLPAIPGTPVHAF
jgi:phenylpropionate dioxygenase-like ring-hydroxylating dioxygenase large terminal subunit